MKYDYLFIGTGQATGTVISDLSRRKKRIAVVEKDRAGGTCVNWGCTPTKTLVASARDAHMIRRAGDFGITVDRFSVDFPRVMERVNGIRNSNSEGLESWLRQITDYYSGSAMFVDAHTIEVGGKQITADTIVIHTGTRSRIPDVPGVDTVPWLDNRGILALKKLPEHLVVVGTSYIALEFAQAFRRLGSEVSIVGRSNRILSREDSDIAALVLDMLVGEGIVFHLESDIKGFQKRRNGGVSVHITRGTSERKVEGSHLLLAVGRVPNSDMLNLDGAGVAVDSRGFITVNSVCQTSVPHIYALGDVNGRGAFTHTSVHDGQVFLDHLAGGRKTVEDRRTIHSMFIDPPLARVGMSETEALKSGRPVLMATMPMSSISRAKEKAETQGLIKIIVDSKTGLILGATIFGVGGDEIIGMPALAMQADIPYTAIQDTVLPHPTVSELIPWVFPGLSPLEKQASE